MIVRGEKYRPLSVYAKWLYVYYKSVCGDSGVCFQATKVVAESTGISAGKVSQSKRELEDVGLIKIEPGNSLKGRSDKVRIIDVWSENLQAYAADNGLDSPHEPVETETAIPESYADSPHESTGSRHESSGSPHEPKKNPTYKKEPKDKEPSPSDSWSERYEKARLDWNKLADDTGLSPIRVMNKKRRVWVRARWTNIEEHLPTIYAKIRESDFLRGDNDRGWTCDFDFIWGSTHNFVKIIEGKYDDAKNGAKKKDRYAHIPPPGTVKIY